VSSTGVRTWIGRAGLPMQRGDRLLLGGGVTGGAAANLQ
jgi:hypothetical protein